MSANHEFVACDRPAERCAMPDRCHAGNCNHPRSEHPVEDGYERSDIPPRKRPPAQVVEEQDPLRESIRQMAARDAARAALSAIKGLL